jgi:ABC-type multidrug transport system permease subunit
LGLRRGRYTFLEPALKKEIPVKFAEDAFTAKEVERMSRSAARLLFWSPRILAMALAIFLSLFALDAFREFHGFWVSALAFCIHLIPALIVIAVLVAAWKWEWIGAVVFALLAVIYSWTALHRHLHWLVFLAISLPLLVIARLFLANWIERAKLRTAH